MTDLAGATNFLWLALIGFICGQSYFTRQAVLTGMVTVWSLRLGLFLFVRVLVRKKDARFDNIRDSLLKLAFFWSFQVVWVWVVSLPLTFINSSYMVDVPVNAVDYVAWSLWGVSFVVEAVADQQRYSFSRNRRQPRAKPFLDSGLWRYSRHPNYFGEIVIWFSIWLSAANGLWSTHVEQAIIALCSPLLTFVLLMFVSGIPMAEKRDDVRNHRLMAYKQYKYRTSILIPIPPSIYAPLPLWVKKWILFDRYQLAFITPNVSHSLDSSPKDRRASKEKASPYRSI